MPKCRKTAACHCKKRLEIKCPISQAGTLHTKQQHVCGVPLPYYQSCSLFGDCKLAFLHITVERRMGIYSTSALDYGTEGIELLFSVPPFLLCGLGVFSFCVENNQWC